MGRDGKDWDKFGGTTGGLWWGEMGQDAHHMGG
jgi:hypothetical protein